MSAQEDTVTMPVDMASDKKRKDRDEGAAGSETLNRSEKKRKDGSEEREDAPEDDSAALVGNEEMKDAPEADSATLVPIDDMMDEPEADFDLNRMADHDELPDLDLNRMAITDSGDEADSDTFDRSDKKRKIRDEEDSEALNRREKKKGKLHDDPLDVETLLPDIGRDNSINCLVYVPRFQYGAIATLNRNFLSLIRSGELYQTRRRLGIVEHWIYFSVSFNQWEAYDPSTMKWMSLPRMQTDECFMFSDKESLGVGMEVLVFGKSITSHTVHKYSLMSNSWSRGTPLKTPRCLFASGSKGTLGIIAGGCDPSGQVLGVVELYNSDTAEWISLPNMNKPRKMCSAVFMDGKFYVVGGIDGDRNPLSCGEVLDLETMTWQVIPDMYPRPAAGDGARARHATEAPPLIGVVDNELYLADHATHEIRKYNKGSNSWVAIGHLPRWVSSMNGWGIGFRACGKRLMVIGGPRAPRAGLSLNSWIPSEGPPVWTMLDSKPLGNFVYNCAVMGC